MSWIEDYRDSLPRTTIDAVYTHLRWHEPKPHCCPVCGGRGFVPGGFYDSIGPEVTVLTTTLPLPARCRSCWGTGVVWG